jgi:hypothetical protein
MVKKHKAAQSFAKSFIPKSNFGIKVTNIAFPLLSLPLISQFLLNQFKDSELKLKVY